MSRVVVIGAGAMGLAAAYRAVKLGHQVDLIEASPEPGGMAGHFDFDGISIERFYHFVCHNDLPTFALMKELGIGDKLVWRPTTMGFFSGNTLHPWGEPISLLKLPGVSLIDKLRYGLFAFVCTRRNHWPAIENESAKSWIIRWSGAANYDRFWKPLFAHKFYEYADNISAAWIWTRIRRVGRSRKSIFQEELGYIDGGSITLINSLVAAIQSLGGRVHLGNPVQQITVEQVTAQQNRVTGVQTAKGHFPADAVICTAPTPLVSAMIPELPSEWKDRYNAIHNIGVICVIFKLTRSVTPHFWVNVSEPDIDIPGVIEFSNLRKVHRARRRPGRRSIRVAPAHQPQTHNPGHRRHQSRSSPPRPAHLRARLPLQDPARPDSHRWPPDRRHLLLLSRRPRHRRKRSRWRSHGRIHHQRQTSPHRTLGSLTTLSQVSSSSSAS
jgi:protoporphyrinogen oxidase